MIKTFAYLYCQGKTNYKHFWTSLMTIVCNILSNQVGQTIIKETNLLADTKSDMKIKIERSCIISHNSDIKLNNLNLLPLNK